MASITASLLGYEWPRSPSGHSPDVSSPHYPDRPIRPLPRRRLKSRLSPEQADSIIFPLAPPYSSPIFGSSGPTSEKVHLAARSRYDNSLSCNCGGDHSDIDSEEDDGERTSRRHSSPSNHRLNKNSALAPGYDRWGSPFSRAQPPDSASSSADGYESFENTNNKKKRKIPLSGLATSHTALAADMANMGINSPPPESISTNEGSVGQYYGTGTSAVPASNTGTGISGAGRGRFGRTTTRSSVDRRPLGASTSGLNAHSAMSSGRTKREWSNGVVPGSKGNLPDHGIISAAIASAAEQPVTPQKGKENISLLQQHGSSSAPQKTQFTFTCESDSSNKMSPWPTGLNGYSPLSAPPSLPSSSYNTVHGRSRRGMATQGTQTSPSINGNRQGMMQGHQNAQGPTADGHAAVQQPKKGRPRRPGRAYALAAKQRRLQQEYNNFQHPPNRDEIWICEFCEYESIFGSPPEALIKQYEIKDRKEVKRLAEKRRLLEKAKMKGRKGKKNGKNAKAANAATQANQTPQNYDQGVDSLPLNSADGQGDEYFDDEFDDLPVPAPTPQSAIPNGNYLDGGLHSGKLDSFPGMGPNGYAPRNGIKSKAG